jgi:hypothetical protein
MSAQNELWYKEYISIFLTNGERAEGVYVCYLRNLEENETIDGLDVVKEFEDFIDGSAVGTVYEVVTFPDGKKGYVEVEEYEDYDSSCDFDLVADPFEDGVMV